MKTAISIPDTIFQLAENLARQFNISRSELYSKAISEYIEAHKKENVTEMLDKVYSEHINNSIDPNILKLQASSIPEEEW